METSLIVKLVDFEFDSESFGQLAECVYVCAGVRVCECVWYLHVCSFLFFFFDSALLLCWFRLQLLVTHSAEYVSVYVCVCVNGCVCECVCELINEAVTAVIRKVKQQIVATVYQSIAGSRHKNLKLEFICMW